MLSRYYYVEGLTSFIGSQVILADSCRYMGSVLNKCGKQIKEAALTRGIRVYAGHRFRLGISNEDWPH